MSHAVLIPSKGRPEALTAMFKRIPELNAPSTYVGLEPTQEAMYREWYHIYGDKCTLVPVVNPGGYPGNAREALRKAAVNHKYAFYFSTDDNAVFSRGSYESLIWAANKQQCLMSGLGQPALWHRDAITAGERFEKDGKPITIFRSYSTVHWCIPHKLYADFQYPQDCFNDDVYLALWVILRKGYTNFRTCLEAKYSKKRFMPGGNGGAAERLYKMGMGMAMLARDFPEVADPSWMSTHFRWNSIIKESKEL